MRRHWSTTGAAAAVPTRRRNPFRHRWSRPRADGEGDVAVALSLSRWLMRALARLGRGLQPGRLAACRERCVQTWCIIENLKVLRCVSCVFVSSTLGLRARAWLVGVVHGLVMSCPLSVLIVHFPFSSSWTWCLEFQFERPDRVRDVTRVARRQTQSPGPPSGNRGHGTKSNFCEPTSQRCADWPVRSILPFLPLSWF